MANSTNDHKPRTSILQEFNKLFMSLLERCLQRSPPPLRNLVSGLFCGELAYVTRCLKCKLASRNRNAFNELELQIGVREIKTTVATRFYRWMLPLDVAVGCCW